MRGVRRPNGGGGGVSGPGLRVFVRPAVVTAPSAPPVSAALRQGMPTSRRWWGGVDPTVEVRSCNSEGWGQAQRLERVPRSVTCRGIGAGDSVTWIRAGEKGGGGGGESQGPFHPHQIEAPVVVFPTIFDPGRAANTPPRAPATVPGVRVTAAEHKALSLA